MRWACSASRRPAILPGNPLGHRPQHVGRSAQRERLAVALAPAKVVRHQAPIVRVGAAEALGGIGIPPIDGDPYVAYPAQVVQDQVVQRVALLGGDGDRHQGAGSKRSVRK